MVDPFSATQLRVLGSLIEKEATVPDTYPMTLKGLQVACNQKNNREPVTDLDTFTVQTTLDELKARGVVRFVFPSHGARSTKYRHVLDEVLGLAPSELALLAVLVLRGPQTVNELRTRTERAYAFADNDAVVATLEDLADRDDPLVVHLPRQPGQKETRWAHLLGDGDPLTALPVLDDAAPPQSTRPGPEASSDLAARVAELEDRVAALESLLTGADLPPSSSSPDPSPQEAHPS